MGNEELNTDEKAIAELLGALPRVLTPNDFDFRVKARIAAGEPSKKAWTWFPTAARLALPLLILVAIGGYFAFQTIKPTAREVGSIPEVKTENTVQGIMIPSNSTGVLPESGGIAGRIPAKPQEIEPKFTIPGSNAVIASANIERPGGGSFDSGVKPSRMIYPPGINPNAKIPMRPKDFDNPGQILAKDVLTQFGVNVVYSEIGWKVESVKTNSPAQRAGIKAGDVVEAMNDQPVSEKTSFSGRFSGRNMRLKRKGQTVDINLQKP